MRPKHEIADIFRLYGDRYLENNKLTERQLKAFNDILNCRTEVMGFHVDQCDLCGHTELSYNSCRNRNCPKCQSSKQIAWVQDRIDDLLPVTYYHAVFTIPNQTFQIAIYNQKIFYHLLFSSSAQTLKQFAANPKWWDLSGYEVLSTQQASNSVFYSFTPGDRHFVFIPISTSSLREAVSETIVNGFGPNTEKSFCFR